MSTKNQITKKRILITGGRAPVALDLARSLGSAGHEIFVAESLPYTLSSYSKYVRKTLQVPSPAAHPAAFGEAIQQILEREKIDVLIPTCEEIFYLSRYRDLFPMSVRAWVEEFKKLKNLHEKSQFIQLCKEMGLPTPKTETFTSRAELISRLENGTENKLVLKPAYSRFASQTRIDSLQKLVVEARTISISSEYPWLVQECLIGTEYCTYALAQNGETLALSAYTRDFTAGKGAGISFRNQLPRQVEEFVRTVIKKTEFTGQIAFDLMLTSSGQAFPIECNPRATSGLHLLAENKEFSELFVSDSNSFSSEILQPEPNAQAQLRLALLVYGLFQCTSVTRAWNWAKVFWSARDVIFAWNDPLPFFGQFAFYFEAFRRSRRMNKTPIEVTTEDIEWNGQTL